VDAEDVGLLDESSLSKMGVVGVREREEELHGLQSVIPSCKLCRC